MSPLAKSALTWAGVMAALAGFFIVRYELVQGAFNSMAEVSPGACRPIAVGLKGPEDFEIDAAHNAIFISSLNRQAARPNSDAHDGIYLLKLDDPASPAVKLAGTPADFHPHGLSLFHDTDGSETLMAIDHKPNGRQMVEIYSLGFGGETPKLSQQTAVQGGLLVSSNDLAAVAPDKFYVTNDHVTTSAPGRFAEDYLLWPHADVLAFNGTDFHIATQRIALPNGVLAVRDLLYVTAMNERKLLAFRQDQFNGDLAQIGSLSIPARLDNINLGPVGDLIVAGQARPGTAQVYRVRLDRDGVPQSYETIFSDDGHLLSGASSANIYGGHLFIGSARDSKMLMCDVK
jgi:arylesterase/paraoxonase